MESLNDIYLVLLLGGWMEGHGGTWEEKGEDIGEGGRAKGNAKEYISTSTSTSTQMGIITNQLYSINYFILFCSFIH